MRDDFKKYGLELVDFLIGAITPPEEVQKVIDERTGMAAVGNMNTYMQFKAAKSMEEAAKNTSGGAGSGMSMGMGAGMGMMIPGMVSQSMAQGQQAAAQQAAGQAGGGASTSVLCAACGKPNSPGRQVLRRLRQAHGPSRPRMPLLQGPESSGGQVLQHVRQAHGPHDHHLPFVPDGEPRGCALLQLVRKTYDTLVRIRVSALKTKREAFRPPLFFRRSTHHIRSPYSSAAAFA